MFRPFTGMIIMVIRFLVFIDSFVLCRGRIFRCGFCSCRFGLSPVPSLHLNTKYGASRAASSHTYVIFNQFFDGSPTSFQNVFRVAISEAAFPFLILMYG